MLSSCDMCKGRLCVMTPAGEWDDCGCVKEKRRRALFESIGVSPKFRGKDLEGVDLSGFDLKTTAFGRKMNAGEQGRKKAARDVVATYIAAIPGMLRGEFLRKPNGNGYNSLLLDGGDNSGKSFLAACIAIEGVKGGSRVKIFEWSIILDACYDFGGDSHAELRGEMNRKDQIVIIENVEEMYERSSSDGFPASVLRRLNSMFMARWKSGLPMVLTTSQSFKRITSGKYGTALSSIIEDSLHVDLPGEED